MLPDEPGLRWLERLREDPAGARLPVLMLTARAAEGDRVAGLLGGADDYLTKPYSDAELLATLASAPGRVFTRDELLDRVWGRDYLGTPRTVDQHVAQLREKLGPGWIETVRGRGYRLGWAS